MRGKEKCRALKEIRKQIAEKNDIAYVVSECTHQGDCKGTCPQCEAELRYLEKELAVRQSLGKAVAVVGISTAVCANLTACSPVDAIQNSLNVQKTEVGVEGCLPETAEEQVLEGDTLMIEPTALPKEVEGGMEEPEIPEGKIICETPLPAVEEEEILMGEIYIPEEGQE